MTAATTPAARWWPVTLIERAALLADGADPDDIKRRLARGEWTRVRRGIYVPTDDLGQLSGRQRRLLELEATMLRANRRAVVSHRSAALLHGIELLRATSGPVEVTNPDGHAGHRRAGLHTFCAALDPDEIVSVGRHRATSMARKLVDLARCRPFDEAVVAADDALRRTMVSPADLAAAVERASRRPGVCAAGRVVRFADGRSESAGESCSRVLIDRQALPRPEPQMAVLGMRGDVFARGDFGWRECRTIGEFDGAQKYGRLLKPGQPPGDAIYQEKIREDRIRDLGWTVVRWTWADLDDPRGLGDRIRRALELGTARVASGG